MEKDPTIRSRVIDKVIEGLISQIQGARELGMSVRHFRRLCQSYQSQGFTALQSKLLGKPGNHQHPQSLKDIVLQLVKKHYHDYGPSLAHEKLVEDHSLKLCVSTVRKWMIESGIWQGKRRKRCVHPRRDPRKRSGELLQLDGSHHDWFEGRGDKCCLTIAIDDATKEIVGATFSPEETTESYMNVMRAALVLKGRPLEIYTDKGGALKVNSGKNPGAITQFGRSMRELGIQHTFAHSPQAKGRVERCFRTLQDRLVKEMRAKDISSIADANKFLHRYLSSHNKRFTCDPVNPNDAYRVLKSQDNLDYILSKREERVVGKDLSISYGGAYYAIDPRMTTVRARQKVEVSKVGGELVIYAEGQSIPYRKCAYNGRPITPEPKSVKGLNLNRYRPEPGKHPWKQNYKNPKEGR